MESRQDRGIIGGIQFGCGSGCTLRFSGVALTPDSSVDSWTLELLFYEQVLAVARSACCQLWQVCQLCHFLDKKIIQELQLVQRTLQLIFSQAYHDTTMWLLFCRGYTIFQQFSELNSKFWLLSINLYMVWASKRLPYTTSICLRCTSPGDSLVHIPPLLEALLVGPRERAFPLASPQLSIPLP